jgi:glycosyltransferase involved in cell wall biosynthesis
MVIGIDASRATTGQRTGTEAYAYFLINALIPVALEQGLKLRLYFNKAPVEGLFSVSEKVECVTIPLPRLWTHLRLAWELQRRPPDVFFTPAHVIPFSYLGPSVATVHDLGYHKFPEAHTRRQVAYLRWSTGHNARRSRQIIADSQATRQDLLKYYPIPTRKVSVVYPGIDPNLRPISDETILTATQMRYGLSPPYLLYISTLQPRKNLSRLIDAYLASGLEEQLVLTGKIGWRSEDLLHKMSELDESDRQRILLTGFIAEEDKAALITGASAMLYPSLYEGFGFPALEGNACGTPVLCSNTSSLPEIMGEAAILVSPEDQGALTEGIRQIVKDTALRKRLIKLGLANARNYTWETAADRILKVLIQAAN